MTNVTPSYSKFKISRRGRKLQVSDDQRTLVALPKDVPERTWAEILQKEENDLVVFDIREEILESALKVGYMNYMEKQTAAFTVHCATEAWLKLIDWHFYRHDPGEDSSAHPPCYIPKREESWIPDELPDPSPKDTWGRQELNVIEDTPDVVLQRWPSSSSLDPPVVEEIPSEYWFPGKVNIPAAVRAGKKGRHDAADSYMRSVFPSGLPLRRNTETNSEVNGRKRPKKPQVLTEKQSAVWNYVQDSSSGSQLTSEEYLNTESELLQKITDYSTEGLSEKDSSFGELKTTSPVDGSLHGAGDSTVVRPKKRLTEKSKSFIKPGGRSKATLPPLDIYDSRSRISIISDCRLRNLRLDTQYEITSEKVETPTGETLKRK